MKSNVLPLKARFFLLFSLTILLSGCAPEPKDTSPKSDSAATSTEPAVQGIQLESGLELTPLAKSPEEVMGKFTQLSGEKTGLDFQNTLKSENMRKYLLNGAGIATGDFDNDGLVDVYAVSQDGPNRLFRQTSTWQFEDVSSTAGNVDGGEFQGTGAAFADVNNDGRLDIYVCNINGPNLLYINQGNGKFSEEAQVRGLQHDGASTMGSFADFDKDGDLDLYLVNNRVFSILEEQPKILFRYIGDRKVVHPDYVEQYYLLEGRIQEAGQRDCLFINDGTGKFTNKTEEAGIAGYDMGLSATWWDYDNDGWMDLYVANDLKCPDHLYRNLGNGKFEDVIADALGHTPWSSMGADVADINNDGRLDFLVADMSSTTHYKQKTTMGEMGSSAWFLTMGKPRQVMRNSLYVNSGAKRLFEAANLAGLDSTDWSWAVKFADFDSDLLVDVFVTNGFAKNMNDSDSAREFNQLMTDGKLEEAKAQLSKMPPLNEENLAFRNKGDLNFENVASSWGVNHLGVSQGASVADIDRDGDLDLLVNNMNQPLGVYRNDIKRGNNLLVRLQGVQSNRFGLNAKIEVNMGDTKLTRVMNSARGFMSADEPIAHFGLGDHEVIDSIIVTWPSGKQQTFRDIKANQLATITEGSKGASTPTATPEVKPWLKDAASTGLVHTNEEQEFDDFRKQPLLPNKLSQLGSGVAWGDVNNDGLDDCYMGAASGGIAQLFIQNEKGRFEMAQSFMDAFRYEDMGAVFFDLDADGDQDLYVVSGGYEWNVNSELLQDRLYLNDGNGKFEISSGKIPDIRSAGSSVSAADFDRDGDLDLFVGTRMIPGSWPLPTTSYLLENRDGQLVDITNETAPGLNDIGLVTSSVWSDVNRDGWMDLLVTLEWGSVRLLENLEGKLQDRTETAGLAEHTGWWNSITSGDIDNDGDIDFVAMNFGLNTKYHTHDNHPVVLYAKDFDESGSLDLVEAEYEGDVCYPVRGRSCSSHAMPFLQDKFPTYHEFAIADVTDIYSEESLATAEKFEINQLQSMVFLNDGEGKFSSQPLPRIAQISPGFGSTLEDFNGDGFLDLCIAQNFLNPQPETGQMDGGMGLMMQGHGDGTFSAVEPNESGIVVEGQGMSLTTCDLNRDGAPDLLMSINDDQSRIWVNNSSSTNQRVAIRLKGSAGNLAAVGSVVDLTTKSGRVRSFEIKSGSGYLSQSSPIVFATTNDSDPLDSVSVRWPDGTQKDVAVEDVAVETSGNYMTISK